MVKFKIGDTVRCVSNGTAIHPNAMGYKPDREFVVYSVRRDTDGDLYFGKHDHGVHERDLILVKNENLIGRKVKGFRFNHEVIHYGSHMDKYVDQEGTIVSYDSYGLGYMVVFDTYSRYTYPAELIEKYLIEEHLPKSLPKSFACKNTNQELWDKYIVWLNSLKGNSISGSVTNNYYGIDSYGKVNLSHYKDKFDTILSLKEWNEIVNGTKTKTEEVMKKHEITRIELKKIHDVACKGWKGRIEEFAKRNPFNEMVEFTQSEVDEMFKASDNTQTKVLEGIFGKQTMEIDLSGGTVDGKELFNTHGNLYSALMCVRSSGTYGNKAFILDETYNWELEHDTNGNLCLVPTRK